MKQVLRNSRILGAVVLFVVAAGSQPDARSVSPQTPGTPQESGTARGASTASLESLAGEWDYNAVDSVNAATGRPEQAPRAAGRNPARGGTTAPAPTTGRGGGSGRSGGDGGEAFGGGGGFGGGRAGRSGDLGLTPDMMRENRSVQRDLLEVAETLTFKVATQSVSIKDDLDRERTYPVDGTKQKYQLGAAKFDARVDWVDGQLRMQIEGGFGFKMTQTYFLSPDGKRLFLVIRVGQPKKGAPIVGVNRVYDRVELSQ